MTRPPLPSLLRFLPSPRYVASTSPGEVKFDAPCPHGVDVEWTAIRDDSRSHADCRCTCPEGAA